MGRYKNVKAQQITFVFKYEDDHPELLHIWARHRKLEEDAIYIFFKGLTVRNEKRNRWETRISGEVLWWYWIDEEKKVVMVITCFNKR